MPHKSKGLCPRCQKGHVVEIECELCHGTGYIWGQICEDCYGEGTTHECDECEWQPGETTDDLQQEESTQ